MRKRDESEKERDVERVKRERRRERDTEWEGGTEREEEKEPEDGYNKQWEAKRVDEWKAGHFALYVGRKFKAVITSWCHCFL